MDINKKILILKGNNFMEISSALIVDDSKMAQIVLKKQLENRGISIQTVGSGEEAIDFLKQNQPDIIFMDCLMPGMDGFETTKIILDEPDTADIPIIMCTGKESDKDKQKAFTLGASGYMSKSSSEDPLQTILDQFNQQEEQPEATESQFDIDEILQLSEKTSREIATDIAKEITTAIAAKVANDTSMANISTFSQQFTSSLNKEIVTLTEKLEEKVIFSVKSSLEDVHAYIDDKIARIDNDTIPTQQMEFNDSTKATIEALRKELDQTDVNAAVNNVIDEKIHDAIKNNLANYVTILLDHEIAQNLIESKIQEELAEQHRKIHYLEETIDKKANSNSFGIIAFLLATSALAISLYPFLKGWLS